MPVIRSLPRVIAPGSRPPMDRSQHPMRMVTEGVARDANAWTPTEAGGVRQYFDELATEWSQWFHDDPLRLAPVEDALDRGEIVAFGRCLDLGSGTGLETPTLASRFETVVPADLSHAMLAEAPARPSCVQADGSRLPFADATFDVVVLVNAFLFATEMARVLRPHGTLLWISSVGADTPIYLPTDEVVDALGGDWGGVESEAGDGTWAALRRSA